MYVYIYIYKYIQGIQEKFRKKNIPTLSQERQVSYPIQENTTSLRGDTSGRGMGGEGERNYARRNSRKECGYTGGAQRKARVILT